MNTGTTTYWMITNSLDGTAGWADAPYDMMYGHAPRLYRSESAARARAEEMQSDKTSDWQGDSPEFFVEEVSAQEAQLRLGFGPEWGAVSTGEYLDEPCGGIGE